MSVIAQRVWREPAVFVGLLTSLAVLVLALASGSDLGATEIVGILSPFLSALGIRQLVSPAAGPRPDPPPAHAPPPG